MGDGNKWTKGKLGRKHDRVEANRRMQLLITRLRHRLAVCEVEQGEWGRPLKAKDMPVGRARTEAVQEKLEVCCV